MRWCKDSLYALHRMGVFGICQLWFCGSRFLPCFEVTPRRCVRHYCEFVGQRCLDFRHYLRWLVKVKVRDGYVLFFDENV